MAQAQVLLLVEALNEVPAATFQTLVREAAASVGLTPSLWTYDATAATLTKAPDSALIETVSGGPWDGLRLTSGVPLTDPSRRRVLSSFRQNLSGLSDTSSVADATLGSLLSALRSAIAGLGGADGGIVAVRTVRNTISWDRGVPRAIALQGSGGGGAGVGLGVVLAIGAIGLVVASRKGGGLSGLGGEEEAHPRSWARSVMERQSTGELLEIHREAKAALRRKSKGMMLPTLERVSRQELARRGIRV